MLQFIYKLILLLVFVLPGVVPVVAGTIQVFARNNPLGWFWVVGGSITAIGLALTIHHHGTSKIW
jgi:hypothetical protein